MALRRSPRLTPAALAAQRANALKSTGPRTLDGKRRSAWNSISNGWRTQVSVCCLPFGQAESEAYTALEEALRDAILPAETERGEDLLNYTVAGVWKIKCVYDRWIASLTLRDYAELAAGAQPLPSFWRLRLKRPDVSVPAWKVTISVSMRWGRCPTEMLLRQPATAGGEGGPWFGWSPRLHTLVCVTCTGHPWVNGRLKQRAKPECC
ncbi:MAG TPA: hypothetical protein VL523_04935 [Terriglobia bacterium]|nr:hypothetical protein [Terriglobia bacterium]